jgi:hypothetical protein
MKIPYISLSLVNIDDDTNKSLIVTQEKTKNNALSIFKNKSNILIDVARQREKRQFLHSSVLLT